MGALALGGGDGGANGLGSPRLGMFIGGGLESPPSDGMDGIDGRPRDGIDGIAGMPPPPPPPPLLGAGASNEAIDGRPSTCGHLRVDCVDVSTTLLASARRLCHLP